MIGERSRLSRGGLRLAALFVVGGFSGCAGPRAAAPAPASVAADSAPLAPSPRLIVGRILNVDRAEGLAFVDLQTDAPREALLEGAELTTRSYATLAPTAKLRASRYVRGRTLGTTIVSGQPAVGDEVVWLAP